MLQGSGRLLSALPYSIATRYRAGLFFADERLQPCCVGVFRNWS